MTLWKTITVWKPLYNNSSENRYHTLQTQLARTVSIYPPSFVLRRSPEVSSTMSPLIPFYPFNFHSYKNKTPNTHTKERRKNVLVVVQPEFTNTEKTLSIGCFLLQLDFRNRAILLYKIQKQKCKKIPPESMWLPELPVAFLALGWEIFLHLTLHNHTWRIVCSSSVLFSPDRNQKSNGLRGVSPWWCTGHFCGFFFSRFNNYENFLRICAGTNTSWNRIYC